MSQNNRYQCYLLDEEDSFLLPNDLALLYANQSGQALYAGMGSDYCAEDGYNLSRLFTPQDAKPVKDLSDHERDQAVKAVRNQLESTDDIFILYDAVKQKIIGRARIHQEIGSLKASLRGLRVDNDPDGEGQDARGEDITLRTADKLPVDTLIEGIEQGLKDVGITDLDYEVSPPDQGCYDFARRFGFVLSRHEPALGDREQRFYADDASIQKYTKSIELGMTVSSVPRVTST